ncbi:MAG: hypothetical protein NW226_16595 [Microscillaceae bacterium]|nr:hypothetical protein [Microscillaceae bacterium]
MVEIILRLLDPAVIWVLIPLTAIVGGIYASLKREEIKARGALNHEDIQALKALIQNNKELNKRVESLESIITGIDKELLALKAADELEANRQRVKEISEKMKGKE